MSTTSAGRIDPSSLYSAPDFESFWSVYRALHDRRSTRLAHAAATTAAGVLLGVALVTRRPALALLAPAIDHVIAQASHRADGVRTAPWRHPTWHVRAELRLFGETARELAARCRRATGGSPHGAVGYM